VKTIRIKHLLDSIADRGRDFLGLGEEVRGAAECADLCGVLVERRGVASGLALSTDILTAYAALDEPRRLAFFERLRADFGVDVAAIEETARACRQEQTPERLQQLMELAEPRRQELFRRLNAVPGGTAALVRMRADLLRLLREHSELAPVEFDLRHLLASWFNPGFLQLQRIDWDSPARILEKLIAYETVHEIRGWDDLRRRLAADRRCFAFFHPALEGEPLIFVEVALVGAMADRVQPLLDPAAPVGDPAAANTAIFYSINNTQSGLRGISFGDFLVKRVIEALLDELPGFEVFATLSPLPRFAAVASDALGGGAADPVHAWLQNSLTEFADPLAAMFPEAGGTGAAALRLIDQRPATGKDLFGAVLQRLALAYLTAPAGGLGGSPDPVARFHLTNGARLERINPFADSSEHGMKIAHGVMVNYLYDGDELVANHERFVQRGEVPLSKPLARELKRFAGAD
jgi:malonyl-CoA decarboxylase